MLVDHAQDGMVPLEEARAALALLARSPDLAGAWPAPPHDRNPHLSRRRDPFRRLMVRPFETLLDGTPPPFPRQLLDNFFKVVEAAMGDRIEEYRRQCRAVLQILLLAHGHHMEWETYYTDPRAERILAHALRQVVTFLETPTGQWVWIQSMSQPAASGVTVGAEGVELVHTSLRDMWRGLELALATQTPETS